MIDNLPFFDEKNIFSFLFLPIVTPAETIFYTLSVYFMTAGVKKSRYTLVGAMIATLAGIIASVFLVGRIM